MGTRRYNSPAREEASARTRRRIVTAAARLFARDGYSGTTIAAIAAEAGVSAQSVHLAGAKRSLLMAAFELTLAGDEGTHPLHERPALTAIMALPADDALDAYVSFLAQANARTAGIHRALYDAARTDDAVAALVADLDRRRHEDIRAAVVWAQSRGLLRGEVDADERTDVLTYLVSPDTYRFFTGDLGWDDERYRSWLRDAIERLVFADTSSRAG
ncbi:TetR/AcrR family transcriptional regulator [Microbacterium marinilacus]|uniref:TetR/AcrR family transcriptional regulator n=1 Tax=Microbacterium marinilacus TaxID=415209 RepID=A0ABP7BH11_9MICO|nr:TetR family transcriptional regulator [Microbacterium marinilacus]MBY0689592.1 TetR family transcriptional regulator [Microbacterium marinilacus]